MHVHGYFVCACATTYSPNLTQVRWLRISNIPTPSAPLLVVVVALDLLPSLLSFNGLLLAGMGAVNCKTAGDAGGLYLRDQTRCKARLTPVLWLC